MMSNPRDTDMTKRLQGKSIKAASASESDGTATMVLEFTDGTIMSVNASSKFGTILLKAQLTSIGSAARRNIEQQERKPRAFLGVQSNNVE